MQLLRAPALLAALVVALCALALSGIALAVPYDADPADAHASMQRIEDGPWRAVRALHAAAASVALVAAGLAAARAFLDGTRPRAALLGGLALALLLAAFESGMALPSDQRAAEAWTHVRDGALGILPPSPLPWLAWVHALALPLALTAALALLPWRAALARPAVPALLALAILAALAAVAPPALGPAPVPGLAVSRPAWPFLWLVPLEAAWGRAALLALPLALAALVAVAARSARMSSRTRTLILAGVAALWAALTVLAL